MNEYRSRFTCCELCGSRKSLEVHHIIPISFGGPDTEENMIVVCGKCHFLLTPKSLLTKLGIQQRKKENDKILLECKGNIKKAKENPNYKQIGQPKGSKLITKKSIKMKNVILEMSKDFGGTLSDLEVIELTGLARGTYYKYKRELKGIE